MFYNRSFFVRTRQILGTHWTCTAALLIAWGTTPRMDVAVVESILIAAICNFQRGT
jgi:hypothetical protein